MICMMWAYSTIKVEKIKLVVGLFFRVGPDDIERHYSEVPNRTKSIAASIEGWQADRRKELLYYAGVHANEIC